MVVVAVMVVMVVVTGGFSLARRYTLKHPTFLTVHPPTVALCKLPIFHNGLETTKDVDVGRYC